MNLQTWAEWVKLIDALTGGGSVELRAGPGKGMTIAVHWAQDGKRMSYDHALSINEMNGMYRVAQPCVLESITHAVRKMTPNVRAKRGKTAAQEMEDGTK
jgi:phage baseplate assembly protein gpV